METLAQYVDRIMKEKNLKSWDVEARSIAAGNRIADSYVDNIVKGTTTNPSVEKLNALADGLGVDKIEIFKVASGIEDPEDSWTPETLLKAFEKMLHLTPKEIKQVKKLLKIN